MNENNPDRIIRKFSASRVDSVGPLESDQGMRVLSETNSLEDDDEEPFFSPSTWT